MAGADLRDELNCSICLNVYTDPVILSCSHNFCRVCIGRVLDSQEGSGVYSCPECRAEFTDRPALQRSVTLCNIAERFRSTQGDPEDIGIVCTYCVDSPRPALKSCLMCEASLCDRHLQVHSKSPEHVLTDPSTSLQSRKCSVHKKILEYYCTVDGACICVSCSLAGEHRGHQVDILDEAFEKKKAALRNNIQRINEKRNEVQARVVSLQESRNKVEENARDVSERTKTLLRKKLEDVEKSVVGEISSQEAAVLLSLSDQIKQLNIKKDLLSVKIQALEGLCNTNDPLAILQGSWDMNLHQAPSKQWRRLFSYLRLNPTRNLDVIKIHRALHNGLDNAVAEIKRAFPVTAACVTPVNTFFPPQGDHTSLQSRKCSVHRKILEYYCTADGACVCVSCSLAGEHRGHQVEILDEVYEKKKAALRNNMQQVDKERNDAQARVMALQKHKNKVQVNDRDVSERAKTLLRKKLEDLEKSVVGEISSQEAAVLLSLSDQIQPLNVEKDLLSVKFQALEGLCNTDDPLAVLQGSCDINLHQASSEPLQRPFSDLTLDPAQNLDVNKIHRAFHNGLDSAVAEMKRAFPVTPACVIAVNAFPPSQNFQMLSHPKGHF